MAPPSFVRTVFRDGDLLVGSKIVAHRLRSTVLEGKEDHPRSAAEHSDDPLDDHLA